MPHALNLYDGTTTLSLTTGNCILGHYVPQSPKEGAAAVVDPVELTFTGASTTAMQATINDVERLFEKARIRAETGKGTRFFLQYQPTGDVTLWRAEILDGRLELAARAMTVWSQVKVEARLFITRTPFWEGARTQIPTSNNNGSNNTSGLTIWNHDDSGAGNDNWVEFAGSNVTGVLPSPVEIWLTNITGSSQDYRNFYISNNNFDPSVTHILEGEARQAGNGTVQTVSGYSNGQYLSLTGSGSFYCPWDLSSITLQKFGGRYIHLLAAMQSFAAAPGVYVRAEVRDKYGVVALARGTEVLLQPNADRIQDLGLLPLPPGGYSNAWANQTLVLNFRTSGTETINIDFLQLTPAEPLCYRQLVQRGMTVLNNSIVVDDGIEGLTYLSESLVYHPIYAPKGPPVHVFPGINQRIYFLWDGNGRSVDWKLSVKLFYRPRRLTV